MNKTLTITAIVLVAVVMGMSAVAPMMPTAYAVDPEGTCPQSFFSETIFSLSSDLRVRAAAIDAADGTADGLVCIKIIRNAAEARFIIVDNNIPLE